MNVSDLSFSVAEALLKTGAKPVPHSDRPPRWPTSITISREVGALGSTVASEVGKHLGWPVYDQEILHKVAEEMKRPTFHVRNVDERHIGWLEELLTSFVTHYHVSPAAYLKYLIGVVRGLGAMGHCVLVGRGANLILPPESTIRVRLVADRKDRVRVIGFRNGTSDREAEKFIDKTEHGRQQFVREHFNVDVADPHLYDLVLNTSRVTVDECARLILELLRSVEAKAPVPDLAAVM